MELFEFEWNYQSIYLSSTQIGSFMLLSYIILVVILVFQDFLKITVKTKKVFLKFQRELQKKKNPSILKRRCWNGGSDMSH